MTTLLIVQTDGQWPFELKHFDASVKCPIGRYEKDGVCTDCPANTYSNTVGSTKCTDCSDDLKTITTGSDSESDCTGLSFLKWKFPVNNIETPQSWAAILQLIKTLNLVSPIQ